MTLGQYTPDNFIIGNFVILAETKTVATGKTIRKYAPVVELDDGTVREAEKDETTPENGYKNLYGIATGDFAAGEPAVLYITGDFRASEVIVPDGLDIDKLTSEFKKTSIFLRK